MHLIPEVQSAAQGQALFKSVPNQFSAELRPSYNLNYLGYKYG